MLLEDHHELYKIDVRKFMSKVVEPAADELDLTRPLTREEVRGLRARFAAHEIANTEPQREDGTPDLVAIGIFTEELNRVDASLGAMSAALFFSPLPISSLLSDDQRGRYGRHFEPGHLVSVGLSEPEVGSNPAEVRTTAKRDGGNWVINGRKLWTSNATISDAVLVTCRVPEEEGKLSLFLVEREGYPYQPRPIPCLGMTGVSTCEVDFEDCRVPDTARIGGPGGGLRGMLTLLDRARLNISFTSVGIAQAALEEAVGYARTREQFGRTIGSFQLVQELLADMATQVTAARTLALHAATLVQAGRPARAEVSMAKAYCTEMAVTVASQGIQVHGGMGLTKECRAERYFRDARMQTIPDGTTQIHKLIIGRELTGTSALV
ncbi:MAG TPA: acyl-CoA dehydrogenase [Pseudonocardia sp.]|jgi:alkylation response protein AidB-like acyl-CoA dehydrogenase